MSTNRKITNSANTNSYATLLPDSGLNGSAPKAENTAPPESNTASTESGGVSAKTSADASEVKTGPKKYGNRNALCHGLYSNELTLPWESEKDFERLHASFKDEWKPYGASEEQAVIELAHYTWILWRASKTALVQFHKVPFGGKRLKSGDMSWPDVLEGEHVIPKLATTAKELFQSIYQNIDDLFESIRSQPYQTDTVTGKAKQLDIAKLGSAVIETIKVVKESESFVKKVSDFIVTQGEKYEKAYLPDEIEKQVRVMAMVDARIDKILRRLTSLKEYKRCAAVQTPISLVQSPPTAPDAETKIKSAKGRKKLASAAKAKR